MKGSVFKYYNCHFQGRPRPEPWRSWRDLILQRVPAVVTSPNGASPQSKHCNPPIPSHSRISQLVPPEYGGNLGRGKIGTQTGVIFAAPSRWQLSSRRCQWASKCCRSTVPVTLAALISMIMWSRSYNPSESEVGVWGCGGVVRTHLSAC